MSNVIDIEKLKFVKVIVTHDNCSDGLASALILKDALKEAEVIFVQHGTEAYKNLQVCPGMLFADIVPYVPKKIIDEGGALREVYDEQALRAWIDAGTIVLDHHKGVEQLIRAFGENAVFGDENKSPGTSGTTLAYEHVWKPLKELELSESRSKSNYDTLTVETSQQYFDFVSAFARKAGIRDTWQRHSPEWNEACLQSEVLHFYPREHWFSFSLNEIYRSWEQFRKVGEVLQKKQKFSTQKVHEESRKFLSARGTRVVCFNHVRSSSDVAELIDQDADLVIGFTYKCETQADGNVIPKFILSTRSHTFYDCMSFAKHHGGGGHTKAAGCSFEIRTSDPNPYQMIENIVNSYESHFHRN